MCVNTHGTSAYNVHTHKENLTNRERIHSQSLCECWGLQKYLCKMKAGDDAIGCDARSKENQAFFL